jgi:hypothetical protein
MQNSSRKHVPQELIAQGFTIASVYSSTGKIIPTVSAQFCCRSSVKQKGILINWISDNRNQISMEGEFNTIVELITSLDHKQRQLHGTKS